MMPTLQASREQCPRDLLLDWELLWCEVLQRSRAWLLAHCEYAPTSGQWQAFQGYWGRRLGGVVGWGAGGLCFGAEEVEEIR